jgi:hypothetical protein
MWTGAELLFSLYFRYYTQIFFVTRLIINQINKVQWVDFKLENVLVSLHSLNTMGLGSIIFKEWRVTWTFSNTYTRLHLPLTLISRLLIGSYYQNPILHILE